MQKAGKTNEISLTLPYVYTKAPGLHLKDGKTLKMHTPVLPPCFQHEFKIHLDPDTYQKNATIWLIVFLICEEYLVLILFTKKT